jgi:glycosyltransferase involved in cell wall biosynthesis
MASISARKLRIAHVHWAFPPTTGGVESHLFDLARRQADAGHRVTVVTGEPQPTPGGDYEVVSTPLLRLDAIREAPVDRRYAGALREMFASVLGERAVSVVHAHDLHHFTPEPALALTELRARLRFALHHSFHETWPDVLADRPVYRSWEGNYAVSRYVQRGCAERIGFEPALFPLAVDTDVFASTRPILASSQPPTLLHPARLLPWKGVHVTIEMLALLRARGVRPRLLLTDTQRIADWDRELDSYRARIRALIADLELADQVRFVRASFADMPALYDRADLVLYPTVADEPFGLVPLEAMSCRRPVVAARCGGIAETVVDGVTGFTVRPGDANALAERVAELLGDPERARAMGAAGRRHVQRRFDLSGFCARLEQRYVASAPAR